VGYRESKVELGTKIEISCDALKGTRIYSNRASVTMPERRKAQIFLFTMGWRILENHQVCGSCLSKKNLRFSKSTPA